MKRWLFAGLLLLWITGMSAACGRKAPETDRQGSEEAGESTPDEELVVFKGGGCISGQGVLFRDDILNFYDFQTGAFYPLCGKPNCTHKDEECTAVRIRQSLFAAIYKGSLYYVRYVEERGLNCFCRAEISGEGETVIAEVSEYDLLGGTGVLFYGDRAYLEGSHFEDEEAEEGVEWSVRGTNSLLALELESGEMEPIMEMSFEEGGSSYWEPEHIYGGKLYFYFGTNVPETEYEPGWYTCDLESGELTCLELSGDLEVSAWDKNAALCQERSIDPETNHEDPEAEKRAFRWDLDTGELEELYTFRLSGPGIWLEDGYAHIEWKEGYREGEWKLYRWDTGEDQAIGSFTSSESFFPVAAYRNGDAWELVGNGTGEDANGRISDGHFVIGLEEFLEGKTGYRRLD